MLKKVLPIISLFVIAALIAGCAPTLAAQAQGTPAPTNPPVRTISVNGIGKAYLTPDLAYVNIGVHTENAEVKAAVDSNNTQAQKIVDAIKAQGVDAKDIQTSNFSIYPMQKYSPTGEQTGSTYAVDNTVYITVRDLSKLSTILDASISAGANSINGVQFDVADRSKAESSARAAALQNAQAQAQELASAAGVQLGEINSISTFSGGVQPMFVGGKGGAAMDAASVPIQAGQLTVEIDVTVVYEIQ
jgi:uncharacterized protein YggE